MDHAPTTERTIAVVSARRRLARRRRLTGITMAGGVELPAECEAVLPVVRPDPGPPDGVGRGGLFGTVVLVPADDRVRVLDLAGRDPAWSGA